MYVDTNKENNKKQIIDVLERNKYGVMIIYYICRECDDEQALEIVITEEKIKQIKETDSIFVNNICNCCEDNEKFIKTNYIIGIENI